ncbi:hypothetical protein [Nostoc sp. KVJ20]|uniref:hypothetical protein n=1 Tax=Nostoc sp. KVJ20 TaxID=457944 RepID=UPI00114D2CC6|nr:hypothetical protein [Nostoc sp. KVJ20]
MIDNRLNYIASSQSEATDLYSLSNLTARSYCLNHLLCNGSESATPIASSALKTSSSTELSSA